MEFEPKPTRATVVSTDDVLTFVRTRRSALPGEPRATVSTTRRMMRFQRHDAFPQSFSTRVRHLEVASASPVQVNILVNFHQYVYNRSPICLLYRLTTTTTAVSFGVTDQLPVTGISITF